MNASYAQTKDKRDNDVPFSEFWGSDGLKDYFEFRETDGGRMVGLINILIVWLVTVMLYEGMKSFSL